jgi:hypothetical protein
MNKHTSKVGVTCNTHAKDKKRTHSSDHKPDWRTHLQDVHYTILLKRIF